MDKCIVCQEDAEEVYALRPVCPRCKETIIFDAEDTLDLVMRAYYAGFADALRKAKE